MKDSTLGDRESCCHNCLSNYESQNENWYGLENEEEEKTNITDSRMWWHHIYMRHELILIRNDNSCIMGDPAIEPKLELFKYRPMPYIMLNEVNKLSILRALKSERYLNMFPFCTSIFYCRAQRNTRGLSRRLSSRSRKTSSLLYRL